MRRMAAASRVTVARQLALAAATVEVLDAMAEAGIRTVMLKGAAIATRLYDSSELRPAGDVDLLVAPSQASAAAQVLTRLGFHDPLAGARANERSPHAVTFRREGPRPACVDLHTALALCKGDPETLWDEFSRTTTSIHVAGRPTEVLGDHAQAFVVAAHALQHGGASKQRVDLQRAVARYDRETWEQAASMARRLGAERVLAGGLRLSDAGTRLADGLALTEDDGSVEIRLRQAGAPPVAFGVMRLAQTRSLRQRLQLVLRELIPTRPWMRVAYPFAARGPAALALAYLYRPFWLAVRLPRALTAWRRASKSRMSRVSALTPGNTIGAAWAWRAASRGRRQLKAGGLHALSLPPPPVRATWRGVGVVLNRRNLTCLERAAVRQRWHSAHGSPRDLIVGVGTSGDAFAMHAWLEGDPETQLATFSQLLRHEARIDQRS